MFLYLQWYLGSCDMTMPFQATNIQFNEESRTLTNADLST